MNYIDKLQRGTLTERLQFMADDYLGPCGQDMQSMQINRLKRQYLLAAIHEIDDLKSEILRVNREITRLEQTVYRENSIE